MHHNSGGNNGNGKHGSKHFNPRILSYGSASATPDMSSSQSQWNPLGTSIQAMFMSKRPSLQDSILEVNICLVYSDFIIYLTKFARALMEWIWFLGCSTALYSSTNKIRSTPQLFQFVVFSANRNAWRLVSKSAAH